MRLLFLCLALVSTWLTAAATTPGAVQAHFGGGAYIIVPLDRVNPGEPFEVIGADLTPNSDVTFHAERDELVVPLSDATSGADGHFTAMLTLPSNFPAGYTLLVAQATDGTETSTWVLVGPRTGVTPPPPGQPAWWADPSVIVLALAVVGGAGALAYALLRRRQPQRVPVTSGCARRRSCGKAHRRAARRGQV